MKEPIGNERYEAQWNIHVKPTQCHVLRLRRVKTKLDSKGRHIQVRNGGLAIIDINDILAGYFLICDGIEAASGGG